MRTPTSLLAGLGLLSTAAAALAEPPAKLSEAELGQVAAGQSLDLSFSALQATTTTTSTTSTTNDADTATSVFKSDATAAQDLAAESTNSVNGMGMLGSTDVSATGNANAVLTGTIANSVP
jgi:hypothetical protein